MDFDEQVPDPPDDLALLDFRGRKKHAGAGQTGRGTIRITLRSTLPGGILIGLGSVLNFFLFEVPLGAAHDAGQPVAGNLAGVILIGWLFSTALIIAGGISVVRCMRQGHWIEFTPRYIIIRRRNRHIFHEWQDVEGFAASSSDAVAGEQAQPLVRIGSKVDLAEAVSDTRPAFRDGWLCAVLAGGRTTASFRVNDSFRRWLSEKLAADVLSTAGARVAWEPIRGGGSWRDKSLTVWKVVFPDAASGHRLGECTAVLKLLPNLRQVAFPDKKYTGGDLRDFVLGRHKPIRSFSHLKGGEDEGLHESPRPDAKATAEPAPAAPFDEQQGEHVGDYRETYDERREYWCLPTTAKLSIFVGVVALLLFGGTAWQEIAAVLERQRVERAAQMERVKDLQRKRADRDWDSYLKMKSGSGRAKARQREQEEGPVDEPVQPPADRPSPRPAPASQSGPYVCPEGILVKRPGPDSPRLVSEHDIMLDVAAITPDGSMVAVHWAHQRSSGLGLVDPFRRWCHHVRSTRYVEDMEFLPDGEHLCMADDRGVGLMRFQSYRRLAIPRAGQISVSPDGKAISILCHPLCSIDSESSQLCQQKRLLFLIDPETKQVRQFDDLPEITKFVFAEDSNSAIAVAAGELIRWDTETAQIVAAEPVEKVFDLAMAHEAGLVATIERQTESDRYGEVALRDATTLSRVREIAKLETRSGKIDITSRGDLLVTDCGSGALVYNLNDEEPVPWWIEMPCSFMTVLEISKSGSHLLIGGQYPSFLKTYYLSPCRATVSTNALPSPKHPFYEELSPPLAQAWPRLTQHGTPPREPEESEMRSRPWPWNARLVRIQFPCEQAVFSADSKQLALVSGQPDRESVVIDPRTGEQITRFPAVESVEAAVFSPGGEKLFMGCDHRDGLRVWNASSGELELLPGPGSTRSARSGNGLIDISPDGSTLAIQTGDGVELVDTATGNRRRLTEASTGHTLCLRFSPDGTALLRSRDGTQRWNIETGQQLASAEMEGNFDVCGSLLAGPALFRRAGPITLYDVNTLEHRRTLRNSPEKIRHVAFSGNGNLVAADAHFCVLLYDLRDDDPLPWRFEIPWRYAAVLDVSPDGKTLMAGVSHDDWESPTEIFLWDISPCLNPGVSED